MAKAPASPSIAGRLIWFVGLWLAGVLTVGSVALLIRWWLA